MDSLIANILLGISTGYLANKTGIIDEKFLKTINEIKARKDINDKLKSDLKVLDELEKKEKLTQEEKRKLAVSLDALEIKRPGLGEEFKKWKDGKIKYAEYLKPKNQIKEELDVNNLFLETKEKFYTYEKLLKQRSDLLKQQKALSKIRNKTSVQENEYYEVTKNLKSLEMFDIPNIIEEVGISINKLDGDGKKNGKNLRDYLLKNIIENLKQEKKDLEKIISRYDNKTNGVNTRGKNGDKHNKYVSKEEHQSSSQRLSNVDRNLEMYLNMEKNDIAELKKVEEKKIDDKNIIKLKKNEEKKVNKNDIEEKYKKEELKINTEYNEEIIKETERFNKKMEKLLEDGKINEIEKEKQIHEINLKTIEEKNKEKILEHQKTKSTASEMDIKNIDSRIKMIKTNSKKEKNEKKYSNIQLNIQNSINNAGAGLKNLTSMFQMLGDVTGKQSIKDISNVLGTGSSLFDFLSGNEIGKKWLTDTFGSNAIPSFDNFNFGNGIGNIISGALGGGTEGNLGSMIGSGIGTAVGGPVGSIVGGAIGSIGGSIFGSKSKKKKKREERKRKAAQERLQRGLISGQYKWQDVIEAYNEDLLKLGTGSYMDLYDKVSANTDYDNVLSSLNGAKSGSDGVSMTTLKQLMPQYNEQQIMDWFKSLTGGAVLKGDILSTGEGKYGAIDIGELAKQVTNANRDLEKTLKTTIKGIINFSADSLAAVVKKGFFGGMEDLGNDIESMLAESLKNTFVNTEMSKSLFNGMSDKVSDVVKEMFVKDGNLGIDLETGDLENLSLTQYMELIKKYTEISNEKLEELFRELGLNMDNLTGSMNNLNKNMSKNTVQGMATNLWRYNLGQNMTSEFNGVFEVEIPIILGDQLLDKRIIKITSDSIRKARRNKF